LGTICPYRPSTHGYANIEAKITISRSPESSLVANSSRQPAHRSQTAVCGSCLSMGLLHDMSSDTGFFDVNHSSQYALGTPIAIDSLDFRWTYRLDMHNLLAVKIPHATFGNKRVWAPSRASFPVRALCRGIRSSRS
jgi:hypothetical protein